MKSCWIAFVTLILLPIAAIFPQPIIVDHACIDISQIPVSAVESAKQQLHIGYGHTSHGSQITGGMTSLVAFMNSKGYPHNLFQWNNAGSNGALHLAPGGDLYNDAGYYPAWVNATRNFLGVPNAQGRGSNHPVFNVIMWAWCGQLSGYSRNDVFNKYLNDMSQLEQDYPGVTFVYMTGHSDGSGLEGQLHKNNQTIRDYCTQNNKVLYDFYDIECYDPDGNYFGDKYVNDGCYYDGGNWAIEWQNSHTEGVDWYSCDAAHTEALNGNMKAYAAWWLWARLAGWGGAASDSTPPSVPQNLQATVAGETQVNLTWDASTDAESGVSRYRVYRNDQFLATSSLTAYSDESCIPGQTYRYEVSALNGAGTESGKSAAVEVSTPADSQPPSMPTGLTASPVSSNQIDLSWNASTDNTAVAGYHIYRNGADIGTVVDTHYLDSSLSPATTYQYQISAFDVAGNESNLSEAVAATTLDPTQERTTIRLENESQVDDSFIFANEPNSNYGSEPYVGEIDRFLIKFNLPSALAGKQIVSAKLFFYVWNQTNFQDNQFLDIYRVTKSWEESSVTWINAKESESWTTPGGDYDASAPVAQIQHQSGGENWDHTFYPPADITTLVQAWADGAQLNYGLLVTNDGQTEIGFKASEYGEGSRPYLEIVYTDKTLPTAVETECDRTFQLCSNFPNPFNTNTTIQFDVPEKCAVEVIIFDLHGREIETLVSGQMEQGVHQVHFAAENLASGVYLCSVQIGPVHTTRKMVLVR